MLTIPHALVFAGAGLLLLSLPALADEHKAAPGDGTISAAAAKAKEGDTIVLEAGEYTDSVRLPGGVTLKGAGAGKTILTGKSYAAIYCEGPHVTISGLTIRHAEGVVRGVNTSTPVRVERCRFEKVPEAVALMTAPLSDVVACEFHECGIGVRAIAESAPTVWGCRFTGGRIGVFNMEGAPHIRNNVFDGVETGVRLVVGENADGAIIRSNVSHRCRNAAIEAESRAEPIFGPSIRNNIAVGCGTAVIAPAGLARRITHNLAHECGEAPFRDKAGKTLESENARDDPKLAFTPEGDVAIGAQEVTAGKGLGAAKGEAADIGPEKGWGRFGCAAAAELPPVRFGETKIANSVREEYQYLGVLGARMSGQSLQQKDGKAYDVMEATGADGKPLEVRFDISRFFKERGL
ncbi:MAG: right-handed parallel beta-helix repeat-containing protein [Phycisphaerales bacterium]